MDKITTFDEACSYLGLDPEKVIPDFSAYPEKDREALAAHAKLVIVIDALNRTENDGKEWFPDWDNTNEYKYEIWWDMRGSSGSGFSCCDFDGWNPISHCGSRLCFKSYDLCRHFEKHFTALAKPYFVK